jgi:hypothetical protein
MARYNVYDRFSFGLRPLSTKYVRTTTLPKLALYPSAYNRVTRYTYSEDDLYSGMLRLVVW